MRQNKHIHVKHPGRVISYFQAQWKLLILITVTGIIYNVGLLATPWFEGQFAQKILKNTGLDIAKLCGLYMVVILIVQGCRYLKRLYVRVFANETTYAMKQCVYANLLQTTKVSFEKEDIGNFLSKAINDVEDCAEGMRKFLTEIFDTGVALCAYFGLLLYYDWRLALICMLFLPVSYIFAEKMKHVVSQTTRVYKQTNAHLNQVTLDRVQNALTYRIFGVEQNRMRAYESCLKQNEKDAIHANIWLGTMPPIYEFIALCGVFPILYFGFRNVEYGSWNIAMFTTFLSCYMKLSKKSGKAAKLFNHVQKARVCWKRIQPLLVECEKSCVRYDGHVKEVSLKHVCFAYAQEPVLMDVSCCLQVPGLVGITGNVASGKSTFGKLFLNERQYEGSIQLDGKELRSLKEGEIHGYVTYLGHEPELFHGTIEENIALGEEMDVTIYLKQAALLDEVLEMPDGLQTVIGENGLRLSGGQAQRLALARTLAHAKSIVVLDDPFSAVDRKTEETLFITLSALSQTHLVILLSHRLTYFPKCTWVGWIEHGHLRLLTHEQCMEEVEQYRKMYEVQKEECA